MFPDVWRTKPVEGQEKEITCVDGSKYLLQWQQPKSDVWKQLGHDFNTIKMPNFCENTPQARRQLIENEGNWHWLTPWEINAIATKFENVVSGEDKHHQDMEGR